MSSDSESSNEYALSSSLTTTTQNNSHIDVRVVERQHKQLNEFFNIYRKILDNICNRDDRFFFIKAAIEEILYGDVNLLDRLRLLSDLIAVFSEHENQLPIITEEEILIKHKKFLQGETRSLYNDEAAIRDITASVIFELLGIFDINITTEQAHIGHETPSFIRLLYQLDTLSKDLPPQPAQKLVPEHNTKTAITGNIHKFDYYLKIDQKANQARVIDLLPGSKDDPIRCRLRLCDVHGGGIKEALSYVWGTESRERNILVGQQSYPEQNFPVTENLYKILHGLRLPNDDDDDGIRTIWIDAICIDQSNLKERIHQVRLMRDIYTHAQSVVIWLGTDQASDVDHDPNGYLAPLPQGFGGTTMHEYDLVSILREYQECTNETCWTVKKVALQYMLYRCIWVIFSRKWWKRIWTLQEGALPQHAPIIVFQGYQFSFDDLATALVVMEQATPFDPGTRQKLDEMGSTGNEEAWQVLRQIEKSGSHAVSADPPLASWRRSRSGPWTGLEDNTLDTLLTFTASSQATDPRDKIYALESLLPRYEGKLICIDYSEDYETVFKRITARCYNVFHGLVLASIFPFVFESPISDESLRCPSWVLDFRFSNALNRDTENVDTINENVTLDHFIFNREPTFSEYVTKYSDDVLFATPKTLFCMGAFVDSIHATGIINGNNPNDHEARGFALLTYRVREQRRRILSRTRNLSSPNATTLDGEHSGTGTENVASDSFISNEAATYVDPMQEYIDNPNSDNFTRQGNQSDSDYDIAYLTVFFLLIHDNRLPHGASPEKLPLIRFRNIVGKPYFITNKGLVGIATAPVQEGDILAILSDAPLYFVLREADDQEGDAKGEQKHRIVARAAVCDNDINITKWFQSFPRRNIRIV
ncbi:heterokaryon incompatibility protein-domain-containing protein [Xylaria scruposa]|nr:heterokaryon incompatibility protein-domain-containing protein [Xylaria scruposa]